MSSTSYAVSAKARAKYGRFLSDRDYANILACQSVPEVMVYLKSHTHFADALSDVNERDVHRGWLENRLRQFQFSEIDSLCRYDSGISAGVSSYVVEQAQTEQIIRYLILLNSGATEKFIFQYPAFLSKHAELDFNRIANARDYNEFLSAVEHSSYYEVLKEFSPDEKGRLPVSEIENRLYSRISGHLLELIENKASGDERRELTEIFRKLHDYSMVSRIIRMKGYYHLSPEVIKRNMQPEYGTLSVKQIEMMCEAETGEDVHKLLRATRYGKLFDRLGYNGEGNIGATVRFRTAKRYLHLSRNPSVVMLAFILLSNIELENVISLIEGVRYRVDPKVIESLLIR